VRLVGEESSEQRSGRELVLTRLVEVLLIEALRSPSGEDAPPGLLRGWLDARLAPAMRQMHGQLARSWTVAQLAKTAALSRSAFFDRFTRTVGLPPMEYLLAWRMAVAKDLLRRHDLGLTEVAERVGYARRATSAPRSAGTWPASGSLRARALGRRDELAGGHADGACRGSAAPLRVSPSFAVVRELDVVASRTRDGSSAMRRREDSAVSCSIFATAACTTR